MWRVAAATERRRRTFHEFDHDDSRWRQMPVPGHWAQGAPDGEGTDLALEESVLYRHRFEGPPEATEAGAENAGTENATNGGDAGDENATSGGDEADDPAESPGRRWWLRIEGLAQQGDVWLDGSYLGHTDGYFVPHELEVTEQLAAGSEHLLAIEATCRRFGDPDNRTLLTGALQDPELCGVEDLIVGGVWRPVRLRPTGRIAIRHARAVCAEVSIGGGRDTQLTRQGSTHARVELRAVLDVPGGGPVDLRTRVAGTEHVHSHHAAGGENRVEWTVDIDDPPLWWPHALGDQHLCDLTMEALTVEGVHDRRHFRIGFRSVAMRRWVLHVNGERLFAKGANLLPVRPLPGTATASEVADDIRAARNAGLDLVRPVAHIARPELYDAADELGVLVWQDLPIRGLMNRSVAPEARRQAREAVDLLGHRPSVAVWCAHDQPFSRLRRPGRTPAVVSRQGPSWNRDVLDRRLGRVLDRCDGSRPVVPHTGVPPRFPLLDGTTSELWFGLHGGRAADLGPVLARVPAMGRFVSAFGTPVADDQPEVVKTTIETLRRLKYRPAGGFLLHALADVGAADAAAGTTDRAATAAGTTDRAATAAGTTDRAATAAGTTDRAATAAGTTDRAATAAGTTDRAATAAAAGTADRAATAAATAAGTADRAADRAATAAGDRRQGRNRSRSRDRRQGRNRSRNRDHRQGRNRSRNRSRSRSPQPQPAGGVGAATTAGAGGGFGVLDGLRRPKPGWWALVGTCRPLIVVADQLPGSVRAGDHLDLAVHVVNDARADTGELQVHARVLGPDGRVVREHRWAGTARADDCVLVGRLSAVVPVVARPGQLAVELTLTGRGGPEDQPEVIATNRYTTAVP